MPADNEQQENIATAITQVSENLTNLVHDEIELAKAEVRQKGLSLLQGTGAVAAGAVFGIFALILGLITAAWVLNAILVTGVGDIWVGFAIVTAVLTILALVAFTLAWRMLRVGPPTPTMAIDEAKRIRDTVATSGGKD